MNYKINKTPASWQNYLCWRRLTDEDFIKRQTMILKKHAFNFRNNPKLASLYDCYTFDSSGIHFNAEELGDNLSDKDMLEQIDQENYN